MKSNYDSKDMELDEEAGYTTDEESVMSEHEAINPLHYVNTQYFKEDSSSEEDLDEWLNAEMKKHMSKHEEKNEEDALIAIIKSIREELAKIVECSLLATLTQVSVMVIMRFLEKVSRECLDNRTPSTTTVSDKCPYKTNYLTPIPPNEWDTRCHITYAGSTSNQYIPNNEPTPFSLEHSELGEEVNISESPKLQPFRPRPCDYSFDEWLKVKIGHTSIYDYDQEIVFNEWILDSFDVEEEYAKEIGNPYSRRFDEYKRVFDNEVENLSNEYTLRIGKKGYVLDDV
ncbi:hypothetical protein Tco_0213418 [Tanacetum coccineum]